MDSQLIPPARSTPQTSAASPSSALGSRWKNLLRDRLNASGLDEITPPSADRDEIHRVIYEEVCLGDIGPDSKAASQRIIRDLVAAGAEGVILSCTESTS